MEGKSIFNAESTINELNKIDEKISEILNKEKLSDSTIRLTLMQSLLKRQEGMGVMLGGPEQDIAVVEQYFQYVKNGK